MQHVRQRLLQDAKERELSIARQEFSDGLSAELLGMHERASYVGGRVDITSATGRGTRVAAAVPVRNIEPNQPTEVGEGARVEQGIMRRS